MELKDVKKLIVLMNENGLTRLEVEEEGRRILLEKGGANCAPAPVFSGFAGAFPPAAAGPGVAPAIAAAAEDTKTFNSPMVGTFYRAATPDGAPFVKAGDSVGPDSVLCLIEAMKVFNEVKAEMSGTIVEVLAENQEAVEYNQPLFLIRPA